VGEKYGLLFGYFDPKGGVRGVLVSAALRKDRWYHLAAFRAGKLQGIYVDGLPARPIVNFPGEEPAASRGENAFVVTSWKTAMSGAPFRGAIDEVAIYDRALPAEEIALHHRYGLVGRGYLSDGSGDACDGCPHDPERTGPGAKGCGNAP